MHREMTLKQRIGLCLAAFFMALAAQIFLSFYQSGTVLRELDDQMGNFNAISRFQNGVQQSLNALESYRWEYGDAGELLDQLHSSSSVMSAWLWRIEGDLGTVSEEQYLLYSAVCTTYDSYKELLDQLEEEVRMGGDAAAAQLYYDKVSPCGGYLRQYTQQLLNKAITDGQGDYTTVSALSDRVKWAQTIVVALCLALGSLMAREVMHLLTPVQQMIGSYIISVKENYPKGSPFSIKGFIKQLGTSIWALAAVVIVVFGVVGGVFTATESAAIAVIYSLFVSVFIYKGLDWKGVWHALDECVNTLSIVLILIATSAVFGNCLTMLHVPDLAANAITSVTENPYIIALLIDLIILVLGCIMDMAPIILIATPILLPIAQSIGIDPIQFGIIVVLNCGIGLLTPPVGAVLFIGSAVAKRPMEKVVKATLPFYLCMFIALLLLTFVPDISLAIPKLLGGYVSPITNPLGPVFIH